MGAVDINTYLLDQLKGAVPVDGSSNLFIIRGDALQKARDALTAGGSASVPAHRYDELLKRATNIAHSICLARDALESGNQIAGDLLAVVEEYALETTVQFPPAHGLAAGGGQG